MDSDLRYDSWILLQWQCKFAATGEVKCGPNKVGGEDLNADPRYFEDALSRYLVETLVQCFDVVQIAWLNVAAAESTSSNADQTRSVGMVERLF
jgi:hypothetical protein